MFKLFMTICLFLTFGMLFTTICLLLAKSICYLRQLVCLFLAFHMSHTIVTVALTVTAPDRARGQSLSSGDTAALCSIFTKRVNLK